jgi:hypothetical protein
MLIILLLCITAFGTSFSTENKPKDSCEESLAIVSLAVVKDTPEQESFYQLLKQIKQLLRNESTDQLKKLVNEKKSQIDQTQLELLLDFLRINHIDSYDRDGLIQFYRVQTPKLLAKLSFIEIEEGLAKAIGRGNFFHEAFNELRSLTEISNSENIERSEKFLLLAIAQVRPHEMSILLNYAAGKKVYLKGLTLDQLKKIFDEKKDLQLEQNVSFDIKIKHDDDWEEFMQLIERNQETWAQHITSLDLSGHRFGLKVIEDLTLTPYFENIQRLNLSRWFGSSENNQNNRKAFLKLICNSPYLRGLRELDLSNTGIDLEDVEAIISSHNFSQLRKLNLSENLLSFLHIFELSQALSTSLTSLEDLNLERLVFGPFSIGEERIYLSSFRKLKTFKISYRNFDSLGTLDFFASKSNMKHFYESLYSGYQAELEEILQKIDAIPSHSNLQRLSLNSSDIRHFSYENHEHFEKPWMKTIVESSVLAGVTELDLSYNPLDQKFLKALIHSPNVNQLMVLKLSGNKIDDEMLAVLVSSPYLQNLTDLDLSDNQITAKGMKRLVKSGAFPRLKKLNLSKNKIGDQGFSRLAHSILMTRLTELSLSRSEISDISFKEFLKSLKWKELQKIDLSYNEITSEGAIFLIESDLLHQLISLNLKGNTIAVDEVISIIYNFRFFFIPGALVFVKKFEHIEELLGREILITMPK